MYRIFVMSQWGSAHARPEITEKWDDILRERRYIDLWDLTPVGKPRRLRGVEDPDDLRALVNNVAPRSANAFLTLYPIFFIRGVEITLQFYKVKE